MPPEKVNSKFKGATIWMGKAITKKEKFLREQKQKMKQHLRICKRKVQQTSWRRECRRNITTEWE